MKEPETRVHQLLQHQDFALDLARRLARDVHGAEDLVQQAWLRALRSPPRDDRGLRGWVARVVVNLSRSRYRADERLRRAELFAGAPETGEPGNDLDAAELREVMELALGRIGERHREA